MIQQNTSIEILSLWCQKDWAELLWVHLLPALYRPHGQNVCQEDSRTHLAYQGLTRWGMWVPGCRDSQQNSPCVTVNLSWEAGYNKTKPEIKIKEWETQKNKPGLDKLFFFSLHASLRYYDLVGMKTKSLCGDEQSTLCFMQQATEEKG